MILDKKTLKNLKIYYAPDKKTKKVFKKINRIESSLKVYKKDSEIYKTLLEELKSLRKIKNNTKVRLYFESPKHGVSTYVLYNYDGTYSGFGSYKEARKWALNRIRTKINEKRMSNREIKETLHYFKHTTYVTHELVHNNKGTFLDLFKNYKRRVLRDYKTPNKFDDYIGVELEFIGPDNREELERLLCKYNLHENVYITSDSSIEWDDDELPFDEYAYGYELNILSKQSECLDVLERVAKVLYHFDAYANETCGFHVHIDMRGKDHKQVHKRVAKLEKLMFKLVNEDRRNNTYCGKLDSEEWDDVRYAKYLWLNGKDAYDRHKTFEIRLHQGTVEKSEILNWVSLLLRVFNYKDNVFTDIEDMDTLQSIYSLDKKVYEFYKKREGA